MKEVYNFEMQRETRCKKNSYSELFWSLFFPDFPAFGLNTERYGLSLRIQSECGKIREKCSLEKTFPHYCNNSFLWLPAFAILSWFTKIKSQKIKNKNNDYISKQIFSYDKVYKEYPSGHLFAQSQQGKNWSNVWNLLKVKRH